MKTQHIQKKESKGERRPSCFLHSVKLLLSGAQSQSLYMLPRISQQQGCFLALFLPLTCVSAPRVIVVQSLSLSVSNPLWPHGLQDSRRPCPSILTGVCSNSCPLNWWCHPAISYSAIPFSSCLQTFPASGSFAVSQLFPSGGESNGASPSALVLPVGADIIQDPKEVPEAFTFFPTILLRLSNQLDN